MSCRFVTDVQSLVANCTSFVVPNSMAKFHRVTSRAHKVQVVRKKMQFSTDVWIYLGNDTI